MRKVFLDDLPRLNGYEGKRIDWNASIGKRVKYIYNDVEDEVEIIGYEKTKHNLLVMYKNKKFNINCYEFKKSRIGRIVGVRTNEFKIEIGQILKDDKRDLTILNREYRPKNQKADKKGRVYISNRKWYKYKCNKCGNIDWLIENALIPQNVGCNACCEANKKAKLGINTIWDTDRRMCELGVSEEDAKKYIIGSHKRIKVICPNCGKEKMIKIHDMFKHKSIGCSCGDGYSYGHKYIYSLLKQLDVNFEEEVSFKWGSFYNKYKNRLYKVKYDFVIEDKKLIIEVDGEFHRKDNNMTGQNKEESEYIDSEKDRLAEENGYKIIRVLYDSLNIEIKKYIYDSELNKMFDLNRVDDFICENFALNNNKIKDICDHWNNKEEWETTNTIAEIFNTNKNTVSKYLKKGTKLCWTNYNPEDEARRIRILNANKNKITRIKMVEVFKNGISINTFKSLTELVDISEEVFGVKLQAGKISMVCNGKKPQYKGFTFRYVE